MEASFYLFFGQYLRTVDLTRTFISRLIKNFGVVLTSHLKIAGQKLKFAVLIMFFPCDSKVLNLSKCDRIFILVCLCFLLRVTNRSYLPAWANVTLYKVCCAESDTDKSEAKCKLLFSDV